MVDVYRCHELWTLAKQAAKVEGAILEVGVWRGGTGAILAAAVDWVLPRLVSGGMIVFDDYGFSGCEGVTQFVNELRANPELLFFHNLNGHAVLVKH